LAGAAGFQTPRQDGEQSDDQLHIEYAALQEPSPPIEEGWLVRLQHLPAATIVLALMTITLLAAMPTVLIRLCGNPPARISSTSSADGMSIEERTRIAGAYLGQYLANRYPQAQALVVVPPVVRPSYRHQTTTAWLAGLREGLAGRVTIQAEEAPELPVTVDASVGQTGSHRHLPRGWAPPLQFWYSAEVLDRLVDKHPDCNLIISLVGLPSNCRAMQLWRREDSRRPKVAVASGSVAGLAELLAAQLVVAAVDSGASRIEDLPDTTSEFAVPFARHWRLLTPDNLVRMVTKYPRLFGP
jgi:hypothetical protein